METINNIELSDENIYPDEQVLKSVLGASYGAYESLLKLLASNEIDYEWRYYRDGKAWLCKVQKKKKTVIWMSAWKDCMKATIYFPQKYLEKVFELDISQNLKDKIRTTKDVGRSKPCIFEISNDEILRDLEKVLKLKIACK